MHTLGLVCWLYWPFEEINKDGACLMNGFCKILRGNKVQRRKNQYGDAYLINGFYKFLEEKVECKIPRMY